MGDEMVKEAVIPHPSPIARRPAGRGACGAGSCLALLAVLALMASGCGFHLRGSLGQTEALPPILLRGSGPEVAELERSLRSGGASVVTDPAQAQMIVAVTNAQRDRRVSAVGGTGRVQEYELHYSIRFRVDAPDGRSLAPEQVVSTMRDFSFDETDVNAKSNEERNLYEDMRFDLVRQILMRVQAVRPSAAPVTGATP